MYTQYIYNYNISTHIYILFSWNGSDAAFSLVG